MSHRILYLVRHGQYQLKQRDQGELTAMGEEQARITAEALHDIPFNMIHVSTVRRAVQTAEIVAESFPGIQIQSSELLRECVPSMPKRLAALFAMRSPAYDPQEMTLCAHQFDRAFAYFFTPPPEGINSYDLLICHGNIIRYFVTAALRINAEVWASLLIHNCGITRVMIDTDGDMFLISHNDIGHLPPDLRTDN